MTFIDKLKEFAFSGSIPDVALGTVIGLAVAPLANSLVEDILLPPFGYVRGEGLKNSFLILKMGKKKKGTYRTLASARKDGAIVIGYGNFAYHATNFMVISVIAFSAIQALNKVRETDVSEELSTLWDRLSAEEANQVT